MLTSWSHPFGPHIWSSTPSDAVDTLTNAVGSKKQFHELNVKKFRVSNDWDLFLWLCLASNGQCPWKMIFAMFFEYFKGKFFLIDCSPKLTCICIYIFGLLIDANLLPKWRCAWELGWTFVKVFASAGRTTRGYRRKVFRNWSLEIWFGWIAFNSVLC